MFHGVGMPFYCLFDLILGIEAKLRVLTQDRLKTAQSEELNSAIKYFNSHI